MWTVVETHEDGTVTLQESMSLALCRASLEAIPSLTQAEVEEYVCRLEHALQRAGRRMVLPRVARRIRAIGLDEDDVWQDLQVQVWTMQRSPRSAWDPARGRSPESYVCTFLTQRAHSVIRDAAWRMMQGPASTTVHLSEREDGALPDAPSTSTVEGEQEALARVLALLDTEEERRCATMLAAGMGRSEIAREIGLSPTRAGELIGRVRALLLPLRDEVYGEP